MNFSSILTDLCHCARNITWRNQHFVSHSFPKCTLKNIFLFFRCTTPLLVNSVANPIPSSGQKIFRCLVHNFARPLQQLRYIYVSIKGMSLWFLSKYIIQLHRACTCPLSFWPRLAKRRGPSIDYCFSLIKWRYHRLQVKTWFILSFRHAINCQVQTWFGHVIEQVWTWASYG